jgi:uncharacterized protein (TIGR02391 family)
MNLDVPALSRELDVTEDDIVANLQRLASQGKVGRHSQYDTFESRPWVDGNVYITEAGRRAVESLSNQSPRVREAQEAWVQVARLERELKIARRDLPSLITDDELRRRCLDLVAAEDHYDRVVREACVVLEDRVRRAIAAPATLLGTSLMEQAFSPKSGPLRCSQYEPEQVGALQLYRGVMAFFRNSAGHNIVETYTQDDALRLVAMVDLLLSMVAKAASAVQPSSAG